MRRLLGIFIICVAAFLCCKQVSGQGFNTPCDDTGRRCNPEWKCQIPYNAGSRFCVCPVDGEISVGGICRLASYGETCYGHLIYPGCNINVGFFCVSGTCRCRSPLQWDGNVCLGANLNEACSPRPCTPAYNLVCTNNRCACAANHIPNPANNGRCILPPSNFGQACDATRICKPNVNLICRNQVCGCTDQVNMVENPATGGCKPKSIFNQPCVQTSDCKPNVQLVCQNSRCACAGRWMDHDTVTGGCKDRPLSVYNEFCELSIDCDSTKNLECHPATMMCVCTGLNIPDTSATDGSCALPPPSTYGQLCDAARAYFCKPNVNLICRPDQTCRCTDRWMREEPATGGCVVKPKSVLNQECEEQEDCALGLNIHCVRTTCQCIANHEPLPHIPNPPSCRRIPSRYDEGCDTTADCYQSHNMICQVDNGRGLCKCEDSYDLDNGRTPCKFNHFNGKTYGQTCEASPRVRRCVVSHNLECIGAKCACLDGFVVDDSTLRDPSVAVLTCRLGAGTKNRGDSCVANPSSLSEKCDTLKGLDCESSNLICICGEGYVPGAVHNDTDPCKAGVQQYNQSCDPSEIIYPPQPIDPRTGLPLPGPISPPPPVFACDISRNLVCGPEGKCICRDEAISERFRLDPKSGHCLVSGGYACLMDEECLSKKCLSKAEALAAIKEGTTISHSHGEKICLGPGQSGAAHSVHKLSTKFSIYIGILSSIFMLIRQY